MNPPPTRMVILSREEMRFVRSVVIETILFYYGGWNSAYGR